MRRVGLLSNDSFFNSEPPAPEPPRTGVHEFSATRTVIRVVFLCTGFNGASCQRNHKTCNKHLCAVQKMVNTPRNPCRERSITLQGLILCRDRQFTTELTTARS